MDHEAAFGERNGELARADSELEHRTTLARFEQELDSRPAFVVHRVPLVVHVRDRIAVGLRPVPLHPGILPRRP